MMGNLVILPDFEFCTSYFAMTCLSVMLLLVEVFDHDVQEKSRAIEGHGAT